MAKPKITKSKPEDLNKKVIELRDQLTKVKLDMAFGKEKNLKKAKLIRKEIAKNLTLITINEKGGQK